jgi:hypothetical protein
MYEICNEFNNNNCCKFISNESLVILIMNVKIDETSINLNFIQALKKNDRFFKIITH